MYIYIYIHIYLCIYKDRERERDKAMLLAEEPSGGRRLDLRGHHRRSRGAGVAPWEAEGWVGIQI